MQTVQQLIYSLRLVTYIKKGKQARIQEKQTLNITSASWVFLKFDFEMAIAITLHSELRLSSL